LAGFSAHLPASLRPAKLSISRTGNAGSSQAGRSLTRSSTSSALNQAQDTALAVLEVARLPELDLDEVEYECFRNLCFHKPLNVVEGVKCSAGLNSRNPTRRLLNCMLPFSPIDIICDACCRLLFVVACRICTAIFPQVLLPWRWDWVDRLESIYLRSWANL
jgi:hypothetical protein